MAKIELKDLLAEVSRCQLCASALPHTPRPVVVAHAEAQLLIIGQAPGTRVHASGIPWNDPSGDRLRDWLQIEREQFYADPRIAIMPMGFCYPGKGRSGDLPPRPECAPHWHPPLLEQMPKLRLTLLIGQYAQQYYLQDGCKNLTERVQGFTRAGGRGDCFPLPHPSPRNRVWLRRNPWFDEQTVPLLRERLGSLF